MKFWLGTHRPDWLAFSTVPLFVSYRTLRRYHKLPEPSCECAIDSGGFSELSLNGRWDTTPEVYCRFMDRAMVVLKPQWAAIQDWMCEDVILQKTGLTITAHQENTVNSFDTLLNKRPNYPWTPVLQGWSLDDYKRCLDLYTSRGFDLWKQPVVGLGTVCRRQATKEAVEIVTYFHSIGLKIHGFGFKFQGLMKVADKLESSDSLAWSFNARKSPPREGCTHKNCANCYPFAIEWRDRLLNKLKGSEHA